MDEIDIYRAAHRMIDLDDIDADGRRGSGPITYWIKATLRASMYGPR